MLLNRGSLIRIVADFIMINVALLVGYVVRTTFVLLDSSQPVAISAVMREVGQSNFTIAVFLSPIALLVFYTSGFYTHGRAYRGRYKALIVFQAVTLAYIILGFLSYLRIAPSMPRGVWLIAWMATLALVGGARLFSSAWPEVVRWEERLLRQREDAPIRRVLVIGGAGYVGTALVRQLLTRGYFVRVLDVLLYGDQAMSELRSHPHFEFIQGDFRNIETVVRCTQDIDAVAHLGAIVGDPAGDLEPEVTLEVNVAATRLIAEIAKGFGVRRFVFTSTCSVYGASDYILDERSATNAVSLYAKSKLDSEDILLKMTDANFSPVILRLGTLYGLSYRPRFDLVVNILAAKAVLEREIVINDGDQWRPFVHVEDAARAIARGLEVSANLVAGQIFNVGSTKENYPLKDIAALVCEAVPGTTIKYMERDGERRNYRVSCDKIEQWLGFRTTHTVRDGIAEIKSAIERGHIRDYSAKEYSNYKFLTETGAMLGKSNGPKYAQQARQGPH